MPTDEIMEIIQDEKDDIELELKLNIGSNCEPTLNIKEKNDTWRLR